MIEKTTEIITKCRDLISEIDSRFELFVKIYLECHNQNITYEEMESEMRDIIEEMDDLTMSEYNEMHKMYSNSNCAWYSYRTGEIVHKLLLEKWYPSKEIE